MCYVIRCEITLIPQLYCKQCDVKVISLYNVPTQEVYVFCPECKTHEIIYKEDEFNKFYIIKVE